MTDVRACVISIPVLSSSKVQGTGLSEEKLKEIVESIDSNADGQIDIGEFIAATLHVHQLQRLDGNSQWSQRTYQVTLVAQSLPSCF